MSTKNTVSVSPVFEERKLAYLNAQDLFLAASGIKAESKEMDAKLDVVRKTVLPNLKNEKAVVLKEIDDIGKLERDEANRLAASEEYALDLTIAKQMVTSEAFNQIWSKIWNAAHAAMEADARLANAKLLAIQERIENNTLQLRVESALCTKKSQEAWALVQEAKKLLADNGFKVQE